MKFLAFFVLLLHGYAPAQAFAQKQDFSGAAASSFHASAATFLNEESTTLQIEKPVPSPRHQEFIEISTVREVEEDDQFGTDSFCIQAATSFFRSSEKSLTFLRRLTSLSSRRHLILCVIRI